MHFTIPYTEEILDNNGKKMDIFKIYINGAHHCSARYSRLHKLYEDLKNRFGFEELPYFPPKKLLKLNESQLEERRESLEYFLQKVSSSSKFNSDELHDFLKTCQKETKKIINETVKIAIYLMDGKKYELDIQTTDHTKAVFDSFTNLIDLPRKIAHKFGLFFIAIHQDKKLSIIRKLQKFEYPFVSLQEIQRHCNCRIVVRKSVWNVELETDIDLDSVGLEILYAQVVTEIDNEWISIPDESRRNRITNLIHRKARKETLQLARTLDYYGYIKLHGTNICSKPSPDTEAIVATGNFELVFRDISNNKVLVRYCLTRIKAWKISTTLKENIDIANHHTPNLSQSNFATLTFEYLNLDTKKLDEVTIRNNQTDQIILLSMSLKNMAEEYVAYKSGNSFNDLNTQSYTDKPVISSEYQPPLMYSLYIGDGDL